MDRKSPATAFHLELPEQPFPSQAFHSFPIMDRKFDTVCFLGLKANDKGNSSKMHRLESLTNVNVSKAPIYRCLPSGTTATAHSKWFPSQKCLVSPTLNTGEANEAAERLSQGHAKEGENINPQEKKKKATFCLFNSAALLILTVFTLLFGITTCKPHQC